MELPGGRGVVRPCSADECAAAGRRAATAGARVAASFGATRASLRVAVR